MMLRRATQFLRRAIETGSADNADEIMEEEIVA